MLIKLWLRRSNFQEKRAKFKHIQKSIQERKMRGAQIPLRTSLKKGLAASGRRRDMMGAWCGASSSLDLRDRGRTGVLAPSAPENVLSEAGWYNVRTYVLILGRRSTRRRVDVLKESTCRCSRRELPTCRSPLVAARSRRVSRAGPQKFAEARTSLRRDAGRRDVTACTTTPRGASSRASRRPTRRTDVDAGRS